MRELALSFLGTYIVKYNGTAVNFSTRKALALLAYLTATQQAWRRETLLPLLWPELDRSRGLAALRTTLSVLRKAFASEWIITNGDLVRLADGYLCDLHQFQQQMALVEQEETAVSAKITHLKNATALVRGDFLAGFTLADSAPFDEWQLYQTEFWRQQLGTALSQLCQLLMRQNEVATAVPYAQKWVALDSLHEPAQRCLIDLYKRSQQRSAALRQYEHFKQLLADELDITPEPETTVLIEQLRNGPETAEPQFQLPANRSLLPFVGRAKELSTIRRWLADKNTRLLTIIGVGGVGKSRLAMQAAEESNRPAIFVPLAEISDPSLIIGAIAQALQFSFYGQGTPQTQLIDYLRHKKLLLVLDNFEQIVSGAPLLLEILNYAPDVKMLVTSRERLHLRGESILDLHGLPTTVTDNEPSDAVRLFNEVAQRIRPSFNSKKNIGTITHICRLVEGMPLGIELAAAWVRLLSCHEIGIEIENNLDFLTTTLQDVPQRQRSLRAVFNHSWHLLDANEQSVLRQLSIFRGGFTRAAATEILGISLPSLISLVDKSLLHQDANGRFEIPMALQTYVQEKLAEHPEEKTAVLKAHCQYYANWLRHFTGTLQGGRQKEALTAVQTELKNLSLAWQHAVTQMNNNALQVMTQPLFHFFEMRNLFQEAVALFGKMPPANHNETEPRPTVSAQLRQGHFLHRLGRSTLAKQRLQEGLSRARRQQAETEIAFALNSLGYIAWSESDFSQAETHYRESLRIYRHIDDRWGVSQVLNNLAILPQNRPEMKQLLEESLAIARQTGDLWSEARTLNNLGIAVQDRTESTSYYQRCLDICREINNQFLMTFPLINLGHAARLSGNFAAARDYYRQSLAICEEIGYRAGAARSLGQLGIAAYHLGQYQKARQYCEDGLTISEAVGDQRGVGLLLYTMGIIARVAETAVVAQHYFERSLDTFRQAKDAYGEAWPLWGFAQLALDRESWADAHASAREAFAIFESIGDQTGLALAEGALGATAQSDKEGLHFLGRAFETASSLSSPPLQMEILLLGAVFYRRWGRLREAYQIVKFLETGKDVSTHLRTQATQFKNEIAPLLQNAQAVATPQDISEISFQT